MSLWKKTKKKAGSFYDKNKPYIYGGLGFAGGAVLSGGNPYAAMAGGAAGYGLGMQEKNYENQVENQKYLRDLQQTIFAREDTSVGRRMEDLRAAGINPILAAGQGADAGAMIKTDPAQREDQALQNVMNIMRMDADISQTMASAEAARATAANQETQAGLAILNNPLQQALLTNQSRNLIASSNLSAAQRSRALVETDIAARDLDINRTLGLPSGGGQYADYIRVLSGTGSRAIDNILNMQNQQPPPRGQQGQPVPAQPLPWRTRLFNSITPREWQQ